MFLLNPLSNAIYLFTLSNHLESRQANETQSAIDLEALRTQNEALALALRAAETSQRRDADAHAQVLHTWGWGGGVRWVGRNHNRTHKHSK